MPTIISTHVMISSDVVAEHKVLKNTYIFAPHDKLILILVAETKDKQT
jgi:hypothetical protein